VTPSRKGTAWLFHVGAIQNYCVTSSRRSRWTAMQVSCLKRKPNMVAGAQGETPEVIGRYLNILFDTYSDTTNVKYVLLCIQLAKIIANRIGVPHLVARGPCAWPRAWEGPRTFYIIYTKHDKTTLEVRELYLRTSYVAFQDLLYNMYSCHTATGLPCQDRV